jgi:hypothetical protein
MTGASYMDREVLQVATTSLTQQIAEQIAQLTPIH